MSYNGVILGLPEQVVQHLPTGLPEQVRQHLPTGLPEQVGQHRSGLPIDVLIKDCSRSCSAILTWVLENVKISVRPLNSIGN